MSAPLTALPPDPDQLNDHRAHWAGMALIAFRNETGSDEGEAFADLLADLMHWADRHGESFHVALATAREHYRAETTPGGGW